MGQRGDGMRGCGSTVAVGLRLTLQYVATLIVTALRRLTRPPARLSWSIGDEARAMFLRRFWRRLDALPPGSRRREIESVPVLLPSALLRARRTRAQMAGGPVTWVAPRGLSEPRLLLYVHGGAFTVGSSHMVRDLLARLALASRCRLLSVDYRLAPEH
ncbi:MAG TPA: alpha/beta hydrolase, partial [Myxococcaceae bacterium]|nr:alpha/beta hydrolase [Myxococcaceae bacterium]